MSEDRIQQVLNRVRAPLAASAYEVTPDAVIDDPVADLERRRAQLISRMRSSSGLTTLGLNDPASAQQLGDDTEVLVRLETAANRRVHPAATGLGRLIEGIGAGVKATPAVIGAMDSAFSATLTAKGVIGWQRRIQLLDQVDAGEIQFSTEELRRGVGLTAERSAALVYSRLREGARAGFRDQVNKELLDDKEALGELVASWKAYQAEQGRYAGTVDMESWWTKIGFGATTTMPQLLVQILAGATTGPVGVAAVSAGFAYADISSNVLEAVEGDTEKLQEFLQEPGATERMIAGTVAYAGLDFATGPVRSTLTALRKTPVKVMQDALIRKGLGRRAARAFVRDAFGEGVQEVIQNRIAEYVATKGLEFTEETFLEDFDNFVIGAVIGGVIGTGVEVGSVRRERRIRREMEKRGQTEHRSLLELSEIGDELPKGEKAGAVRAFLQSAGMEDRSIFVDAEQLRREVENGKIDPALLGLTDEQINDAAEAGGVVTVSTADFVQHYASKNTEAGQFFLANATLTPDGVPASLAQEAQARARDYEKRLVAAEQLNRKISDQRVSLVRQIADRIQAAGKVSRAEARRQASVHVAFIETMSERFGVRSLQNRFNLTLQGPTGERRSLSDVARREDLPPSMTPLTAAPDPDVLSDAERAKVEGGEVVGRSDLYVFDAEGSERLPIDEIEIPTEAGMRGELAAERISSPVTGQRRSPFRVVRTVEGGLRAIEGLDLIEALRDAGAKDVPVVIDELGADGEASRSLEQSSRPLFETPMQVEGTGKNGKIKLIDIARAFTARHMEVYGRKLEPETNEADYEILLEATKDEMEHQLGQPNSGLGWYDHDVEWALAATAEVYPDILTPDGRDVWLYLAGIFSSGATPQDAWGTAELAFRGWLATGKTYIPTTREEVHQLLGEEVAISKATGKPAGYTARASTNTTQIAMFNLLVERAGSPEAATEWLLARHPREEINELMLANGARAGRFKTKAEMEGPPARGFLVFGKKLGNYAAGLQGIETEAEDTTVDLWYIRTARRHTGGLLDGPLDPKSGIVGQPRNDTERQMIFRLTDDLSKHFGYGHGDIQAVLWFYEKRLWAEHGLALNEGTNSDGARLLLQRSGTPVPDRLRGERQADSPTEQPRIRRTFSSASGGDAAADGPAGAQGRGGAEGAAGGLQPVTSEDLDRVAGEDATAEDVADFLSRPGWYIVTATREDLDPKRADFLNRRNNEQLREHLAFEKVHFNSTLGYYAGVVQPESYIVIGSETDAIRMGRWYHQESVLTSKGLIYTTRRQPDTKVSGPPIIGEAARQLDFFTMFGQIPVSMQLDFSRSGPGVSVIPEGFSQLAERPQLPVRDDDGKALLHHWSDERREVIDPSFAGTGPLHGEERIRSRFGPDKIYFGIEPRTNGRVAGTGYVIEGGLGPVHHVAAVDPMSLYPWFEDPDGLSAGVDLMALSDEEKGVYETAIRDAGYLGYYVTDDGSGRAAHGNAAALFQATPVEVVGENEGVRTLEQSVWSASPHQFDLFDPAFIGRGTGDQWFGWGFYLSGLRTLGEGYRDLLTPRTGGEASRIEMGKSTFEARATDTPTETFEQVRDAVPASVVVSWVQHFDGRLGEAWASLMADSENLLQLWEADPTFHVAKNADRRLATAQTLSAGVVQQKVAELLSAAITYKTMDLMVLYRKMGWNGASLFPDQLVASRVFEEETSIEYGGAAGALYKVEIPEDSDLAIWEEGADGQSDAVIQRISDGIAALRAAAVGPAGSEQSAAFAERIAEVWEMWLAGDLPRADDEVTGERGTMRSAEAIAANQARGQTQRRRPSSAASFSNLYDWFAVIGSTPAGLEYYPGETSTARVDPILSQFYRRHPVDGDPTHLRDEPRDAVASNLLSSFGVHGNKHVDTYDPTGVLPEHKMIKQGRDRGFPVYVIWNADHARILTRSQKARAQIDFPPQLEQGETVIKIFEAADTSSFLHEGAHFYLEVFSALARADGAPSQALADLAKINKWLGREEGDTSPYTTEQHEQFAESWEAYVMEARAPSSFLKRAFRNLARMMVRHYQGLAPGERVKLTPEIREVMDRMLATDAEIEALRLQDGIKPLFTTRPEGMSQAEWDSYWVNAEKSDDEAYRKLLGKTMDRVRRRRSKEWRERRKEIEAEVTKELEDDPLYNFIEEATSDGPLRLSRKEIVEIYGKEGLAQLNRSVLGGKRAIYSDGKDALPLQVVAGIYFSGASVDAMLASIATAGSRKQRIQSETDKRLEQELGPLLSDTEIRAEAEAALANEQHLDQTARETAVLKKQSVRRYRRVRDEEKLRAEKKVGEMLVRDILGFPVFWRKARSLGRQAERFLAQSVARATNESGDARAALNSAAEAKAKQHAQEHLYHAAKKQADRLQKGVRKYQRILKRPASLDPDFYAALQGLLQGLELTDITKAAQEARQALSDAYSKAEKEGRANEMHLSSLEVAALRVVNYKQLTGEQLTTVLDLADNIVAMGRAKKQADKESKKLSTVRKAEEAKATLTEGRKPRALGRSAGTDKKTLTERVAGVGGVLMSPESIINTLDNLDPTGPFYRYLKQPLDRAVARLEERKEKIALQLEKIYNDHYTAKTRREMQQPREIKELGSAMTKWELIVMALNSGNEANHDRLTNSFPTEAIDAALAAHLDENDWRFVQAVLDHVNSYWTEIVEVETRATGVRPEKVSAQVMTTAAPDWFTGGYYPIKYDGARNANIHDVQMVQELTGGIDVSRGSRSQTAHGHTNARNAKTPLELRLDIADFERHVYQVVTDIELREPLISGWAFVKEMHTTLQQYGFAPHEQQLKNWMEDIAVYNNPPASDLDAWFALWKRNFSLSKLAINMFTVFMQPLGLLQSGPVVGKRAMARGVVAYSANMGRWIEIAKEDPTMRERMRNFDRDVAALNNEMRRNSELGRRRDQAYFYYSNVALWLMQRTQFYGADMPTWTAAYIKGQGLGIEGRDLLDYATREMEKAQGSGRITNQTSLERGRIGSGKLRGLVQFLTVLGSYMNAKGNVALQRTHRLRRNVTDPVEWLSYFLDMMLLFVVEGIVVGYLRGELGEDDDEDMKEIAWQTGMTIMSSYPVLRDVSSAMGGFDAGGYASILGGTFARAGMAVSDGEYTASDAKALVNAAGVLTGAPTSVINRGISAWDKDEDVPGWVREMMGLGAFND